jgi:phosphoserine phosphatase
MEKIFAYDFDKTIYNGDCSFDFWLYCIKVNPYILWRFPIQFSVLLLNKFKLVSTKRFKEIFFSFLKDFSSEQIDAAVKGFWELKKFRLFPWFKERTRQGKEIVISASPEFLLKDICTENNIDIVIGTVMDYKGNIQGYNCKGEEKVRRLNEVIENCRLEEFYSDSDSDLPLVRLSSKSYKVKKGNCSTWI